MPCRSIISRFQGLTSPPCERYTSRRSRRSASESWRSSRMESPAGAVGARDDRAASGHGVPRTRSRRVSSDRARVDAFYEAALAPGGTDNGAPGMRPRFRTTTPPTFAIQTAITSKRSAARRRALQLANMGPAGLAHPSLPTRARPCTSSMARAPVTAPRTKKPRRVRRGAAGSRGRRAPRRTGSQVP
jgi:hypothetical protein